MSAFKGIVKPATSKGRSFRPAPGDWILVHVKGVDLARICKRERIKHHFLREVYHRSRGKWTKPKPAVLISGKDLGKLQKVLSKQE
jgi:hypothetical protein